MSPSSSSASFSLSMLRSLSERSRQDVSELLDFCQGQQRSLSQTPVDTQEDVSVEHAKPASQRT